MDNIQLFMKLTMNYSIVQSKKCSLHAMPYIIDNLLIINCLRDPSSINLCLAHFNKFDSTKLMEQRADKPFFTIENRDDVLINNLSFLNLDQ